MTNNASFNNRNKALQRIDKHAQKICLKYILSIYDLFLIWHQIIQRELP